jgi:hypothetical protein
MKSFIVCFLLLIAGCSSAPQHSDAKKTLEKLDAHNKASPKPTMNQDELLYYLLQKEFFVWQGTPYRLGGNNKRGIDCSALVKNIYLDSFNIKLPRTTETQVKNGYLVYKNQLQVGDLVFFKTGWSTRHVGIYMGNNEFIHASTSKGVITSSLENVYWKDKYWQARRILE